MWIIIKNTSKNSPSPDPGGLGRTQMMSSHESTPQLWTNTVRPRHTVNIITSMSLTGANQESGHEIVKSHMGLVLTSRSVAPEPKSLKKTSLELVSRLIFSALFFLFFYLTFINIFHQICPELKLSPCDLEVFIPQVHLFLYFTGNFQ